MATWIEMRCVMLLKGCFSRSNAGPKTLTIDDNASILAAMKLLRAEAKRLGWHHTRLGLVCPSCAASPRTPEGTE